MVQAPDRKTLEANIKESFKADRHLNIRVDSYAIECLLREYNSLKTNLEEEYRNKAHKEEFSVASYQELIEELAIQIKELTIVIDSEFTPELVKDKLREEKSRLEDKKVAFILKERQYKESEAELNNKIRNQLDQAIDILIYLITKGYITQEQIRNSLRIQPRKEVK